MAPQGGLYQTLVSITFSTSCEEVIIICICYVVQYAIQGHSSFIMEFFTNEVIFFFANNNQSKSNYQPGYKIHVLVVPLITVEGRTSRQRILTG